MVKAEWAIEPIYIIMISIARLASCISHSSYVYTNRRQHTKHLSKTSARYEP